jgi:hypothetical protein
MTDDKDKNEESKSGGTTASPVKDSRQDRLKSALRENLKRRKMQARDRDQGRGKKSDMPSNDHEASPHGELGKRGD